MLYTRSSLSTVTCWLLGLSKFVMVNTNLILSCCKCINEACSVSDNKSHMLLLIVQGKMLCLSTTNGATIFIKEATWAM